MKRTGAVLVAAGMSSRMGDFKPMLPFGGTTISRHIVSMLQELGLDPVVVVTGFRAKELKDHLACTGVRFADNEQYDRTQMFDSIKIGIDAVRKECDRLILMPVDTPAISPETFRQVLKVQAPMVRTTYLGKPGHPIMMDSDVAGRLCTYTGEGGMKGAMENSGVPIVDVEVEDCTVYWDVDTRQEYEKLMEWVSKQRPEILEPVGIPEEAEASGNRAFVRRIYLVRHGRVEFPEGGRRCIGRTDLPLDEAGRKQAEELGVFFREHPVQKVYASPLIRARHTAELLAGPGFPVILKEDLMELDMGEWENIPLKELKKNLESEPLKGEKRICGQRRFTGCVEEILSESSGDVAIVAHAGINCCYLSGLLGSPLETSRALPQPYGGISCIEVDDKGRKTVTELSRMPKDAPAPAECMEIWEHYHTPEEVRSHCRAVCEEALAVGQSLTKKGIAVDLELIRGAALLHDVVRQKQDHPLEGAKVMLREGYPKLAQIIIRHHDWERRLAAADTDLPERFLLEYERRFRKSCELEAAVVYLADKQIQGTKRVEIEERFAKSRKRCLESPDPEQALNMHERRYQEARRIEKLLRILSCIFS